VESRYEPALSLCSCVPDGGIHCGPNNSQERDLGASNNFAKRAKTVTVGTGGAPPTARATPAPPKGQPATSFKVASTSIPPKQAPPKKAPLPTKGNNKPPKTTDKKVVKTTKSVQTLTFTPGTYTTTSTSASESTFTSVWTTAAPVATTELATITVVS